MGRLKILSVSSVRVALHLAGTYLLLFTTACNDAGDVGSAGPAYVKDTVAPGISMLCRAQDTAVMPSAYNDPGVIVKDDVDNTPYLEVNGAVNHTLSGNYVLRYEASDASGNKSSASRTVAVVENAAAPLIGEYDVICTCTATAKNASVSKVTVTEYTSKVTLAKLNRHFELWLLRVGPEDLLGTCELTGDSISLGFFSNRFDWQCSTGRGRFSAARDTLIFSSDAYEWDPVVVHRCTNRFVRKELKNRISF